MKIFWSWQSDIKRKVSQDFIRDCLDTAAKELSKEVDIEGRSIEVDHDTKGVPGSPPIVDTILKKIEEADLFFGDVTPVAETFAGKKVMNPNVAIEMGYAVHALSDSKIIGIMNDAFGGISDLPFDLRHKRAPISYTLKEDATADDIQKEKQKIVGILKKILKFYIDGETKEKTSFGKESVIYFDKDNPILRRSSDPWGAEKNQPLMVADTDSYIYIRIKPLSPVRISKSKAKDLLFKNNNFSATPLFNQPDHTPEINKYGAIIAAAEYNDGKLKTTLSDFLQLLVNGVFINISFSAINLLRRRKNPLFVSTLNRAFSKGIKDGLGILSEVLDDTKEASVFIDLGIVGVAGVSLSRPGLIDTTKIYSSSVVGPLEDDSYTKSYQGPLQEIDDEKIKSLMRNFIESLFEDIGVAFEYDKHKW